MNSTWRAAAIALAALWLTACQSSAPPAASAPQAGNSGQTRGSNDNKTRPYVVLGRRYVPLLSADGYHERGVASWYGPNFHGRPTANGERFDMDAMTAAHKTLPLPTYAEVTNLRNGKRVVVRINDRGPFVDNRLIDLSRAAARALDMVGPGTTLVDVRVVPGPGGGVMRPAPPAAAAQGGARNFFVQVGAYGDSANAQRVAQTLTGNGFTNVSLERVQINGQPLHRVRVGPIASVDQFDQYIARLDALGFNTARLAVD